jgi:dipeptidyl aminopeptidase/acylaminoacyl peptidase
LRKSIVPLWYESTTRSDELAASAFEFPAQLDTMRAMNRRTVRLPLVLFIFLIALTSAATATRAAAPDKHPFGLDDYSALRRARALAVSPDGKTVLYEVSFDGEKGPAKREWHLIDVSGENGRKLELPESFEPAGFTRDGGFLYGTYEVGKKGQLGIVPLGGGNPTQIIALPNGIRGSWISPDGNKFAFTADPSPVDPLAEVRHVAENDVNSVYVASANGSKGAWWCPELRDVAELAWSPDSSQLAVVTQFQKIGHHDVRSFLWVCTSGGTRKIAEIPNSVSGIAWANGGKDLAFASTTTDVLTPDHLWTVPVSGGTPQDQTPKLEGSILNVSNDPRGTVWVDMHKGTVVEVYSYHDGKLSPAYRWPGGVVYGPPASSPFVSAPEALAFTVGDPSHSLNVAVAHGTDLQKITHEGDDTLAKVSLGEVRVVNWTAKDGTKLEGILTLPANYEAGKHYPFLVFPHGGPEANDTLDFDLFSRLIAGYGYVVLQPQYRGSTGYGTDFLQAIYQHFGDRAYSDVASASDFAVAQGWADPNRQAIFGWSAGGFMTSWTVTQTHRYKAAIEGAGITDWLSFIPTSDIGQVDYDMRMQEKDPAPFLEFSAVMHADQVTTPLLILHGEADQRVPTFQGREFFVLLAERGKTVRMVTYPGSPHFPRLAEQRRDVFTEIKNWLDKYNP